ncbi:MAG: tRNA (5-methylaminomethyl-2-thiouridine)(34)-methyltransferase MnmD [Paracoccaceae bacterium]|nr:tRNA (5-methylaminomethyl-2-thiouridine)(34)-methyltransferase MnmD [Paracoccaceae bacterium]
MQEDHPNLEWRGEVPIARAFDDPYYSLDDGLAETTHVFLNGNDLPARFRDGFHIAELGFGTGLNAFAALALWQAKGIPGTLHYTSFEKYPMAPDDIARALAAFPPIAQVAAPILETLGEDLSCATPSFELTVIPGDARDTLPGWGGKADAWFLDGFSPAKNPELWQLDLMAEVARHTAHGGTFATYTAAGAVRRALADAGFQVERRPGFGRKRHMTAGSLP